MTRCLDCGSERTTDQCPSCGLTTAAAELTFRHRLMRQTGIFLLGSLAFPYVSQIYPPLDLDWILVFFGLIFFGALTLAVVLERRARNHQEIELIKRIYNGFIPLPWILAATLFINGRLDAQKNVVYYPTSVVGRFNMKGIVKGSRRLYVRAWREGDPVVLRRVPALMWAEKLGQYAGLRLGSMGSWMSRKLPFFPNRKRTRWTGPTSRIFHSDVSTGGSETSEGDHSTFFPCGFTFSGSTS